jgi:hypothetical protein
MESSETSVQHAGGVVTTTIRRGWFIKIVIIGVVLLAIGMWGLYDAMVVYPARGARHAEFAEFQYLAAADDATQLLRADVREPVEELRRLFERESQIEQDLTTLDPASGAYTRTSVEAARLTWLQALRRIGRLSVENTTFDDPRLRLRTLTDQWQSGDTPKPLKAYDIPMQWLFCVFGLVGAIWVTTTLVRTGRKTFRFEPETRRLTLAGGESFVPSEIADLDKRQWHKFFVKVNLKDGRWHKLDLLRYEGLEDWILEMEKHTDGYEGEDPDETGGSEPRIAAVSDDGEPETTG